MENDPVIHIGLHGGERLLLNLYDKNCPICFAKRTTILMISIQTEGNRAIKNSSEGFSFSKQVNSAIYFVGETWERCKFG